jgi:hypothetical protein
MALVYVYLIILLGVSLAAVLVIWPSSPEELRATAFRLSAELRQLLLVIAGGILGSSLSGLRRLTVSRADPLQLRRSLWLYALDVMLAVPMSLIAYVALRGLILSPGTGIEHLNASGVLILSLCVGLYGPESLARLADEILLRENRDAPVRDRLERISSALGVSTLDNYRGHVCLALEDTLVGTLIRRSEDDRYLLVSGHSYQLKVWFAPTATESTASELVEISDGADVSMVKFTLNADSNIGKLDHRKASVTFGVTARSEEVNFTLTNVRPDDTGRVYVEVLQKNRLVEVIALEVAASAPLFGTS